MRQVLIRARALLGRRAVLAAVLAVALGGPALVFVPLLGVPGYELGAALTLLAAALAGPFGIASVHQERRFLAADPSALPPGLVLYPGEWRLTGAINGAPLLLLLGATFSPFLASLAFALWGTACDPFELAGFVPLLVIPTVALGCAAGVLLGAWTRSRGRAALAYALVVLASLLPTAWPILFGPQTFAFNHFLGYLPGPLYDEALTVRGAVYWFRAETLLWAALGWGLVYAALDPAQARLTRPRLTFGRGFFFAALAGLLAVLNARATATGTRMSEAQLREELGGVMTSEHFELIYYRGKPRLDLERTMRDLEFRRRQLVAFFGEGPTERIRVFLYRTPDDKQRLVGAAQTHYAKPWQLALHVHEDEYPHRVLKHELAHLVSAPFGARPFAITARAWVWPLMGIVEGVAVAADNPEGDLTLHEWAAAMRAQKLAPDLRRALSPSGFYTTSAARAYTAAGSFFRYLQESYGSERVRAVYASGDFALAYGRSLDELVGEWETFLGGLPLDSAKVNQAFARFRHPPLFKKPCAREVARLSSRAALALISDPAEALPLYRRCAELQPDEPAFTVAAARALVKLERPPEAARLLEELQPKVAHHPALEAEVRMAQADVAWAQGRKDEALRQLARVLELGASPASERTAAVKTAAVKSEKAGPAIWSYFEELHEGVRLLELREALALEPDNAYLTYLLGRRLRQLGAPRLSAAYLRLAVAGGELPEPIRREALRLRVESLFLAGDCAAVRAEVAALPALSTALVGAAQEWAARCDFEDSAYKGPLVPRGGFR